MKTLRKMVEVISKNKVQNIQVIGNYATVKPTAPTQLDIFYDKLATEEWSTDEEAADFFFQRPPSFRQYQVLKSKMKNRLVDTIFFIDVQDTKYNNVEKAIFTCWKEITAARMFGMKGAYEAQIELLKRVYKQAKRYNNVELVYQSARMLRNIHMSILINDKKQRFYDSEVDKYRVLLSAEELAEKLYIQVMGVYMRNRADLQLLAMESERALEQLKSITNIKESRRLFRFIYSIRVIEAMSKHEYNKAIEHCQEAVEFYLSKDYVIKNSLAVFYHQSMTCCLRIKNFSMGIKVAKNCLKIEDEGSFNWFKTIQISIKLSLYAKEYQKAYELFKLASKHKNYKNLPPQKIEHWSIIKAFLHYLVATENITLPLKEKDFSKFRLNKFLNEVPKYSKEKRVLNVSILAIQILFLIGQKKFNRVIDLIDAIEKYSSRYIRKGENYRSNAFIKMLLQIPRSGFHRRAVERNAKKYYGKLLEIPIEKSSQPYGIEIIPYEDLWQFALDSLTKGKFT